MELKGQSAIVTGSAQGIGRAIAAELAARGAAVALCDVREEALSAVADDIAKSAGTRVEWRIVDIANERAVAEFVTEIEKAFGGIQILVNNAGIHPLHPIEEITSDEWDRVLAVNLKAQFYFCRAVLPGMRNRKYGRIINIASEAGKNGGTVAAAHYAASKGGVLAFTRNLAQAVGIDGITVNAICPGRIASSMAGAPDSPENRRFIENSILKRIGDPEDVAFAAAYLASPHARFITAESMMVNGGTLRD
ncbi:MAG TPA: SDR family NAD(P)-dependent oxidoreductase [Spirochaetia bacterium]|nr:SDR family NAD(P)-dependent oxidoreductase [Spirochaetia bacterium]